MTKPTPGPWAVNPVRAQVDAFAGNAPLVVCQMLWPTDMRSEEETEANARLIAASPDMFALLKELIDIEVPPPGSSEWARKANSIITQCGGLDMDRFSIPTLTQDRAEAEIERATGEVFRRMKPVNSVVAAIRDHKDEMARLSKLHGAPAIDVAIFLEALSEWHAGIEEKIRAEEFQGSLEWMR